MAEETARVTVSQARALAWFGEPWARRSRIAPARLRWPCGRVRGARSAPRNRLLARVQLHRPCGACV